ncbi:AAA family ATPase [Nocardioides carbamazepini]|uniref:AAA family ATPase n=1 Tax=Nocardioides carbamazepini TaxID=2854259 RepID=UPI002149DB1F|nr:AAA family ATPase [Nocardioides carbamazepini]MCR1785340.1 AAA family ATPase [Nocardioides carbamazepini]
MRPVLLADTASPLANPAFGRAAAALAVFEGATKLHERVTGLVNGRLLYTVAVEEGETMYPDVHAWLLGVLPAAKQRALIVTSAQRRGRRSMDSGDTVDRDELQLMFNDERTRHLTIDGHRVRVQLQEPDRSSNASSSEASLMRPAKIMFGAWTHAGQQAVVEHLRGMHAARVAARTPRLRMVNNWGGWTSRDDLPPRSLASVALPTEQKDRIVADLRRFLAAEGRYNHLAVPWHRGYMFHGPPGTGKTSLVKALASEFGLDLWYVGLSDLKAESSLMGLLAEVTPRSLLLLEDIDTIEISHERDTTQGSISMSSLLNALDGVATPHGLVTVMTTNHFDKLDPALTRPGRMDVVEQLDPLTGATFAALFEHYYGQPLPFEVETDGLTAAVVAEVFKQHLDDPAAALDALESPALRGGVR